MSLPTHGRPNTGFTSCITASQPKSDGGLDDYLGQLLERLDFGDEEQSAANFKAAVMAQFKADLAARLATRFDANVPWQDEHDESFGGFVLYDKQGALSPADWRPIDSPDAYKTLVASVLADAGRQVIASLNKDDLQSLQAAGALAGQDAEEADNRQVDANLRTKQGLEEIVRRTANHVRQPAFDRVMQDRAEELDKKPPWQPRPTGLVSEINQMYFGLPGKPEQTRFAKPDALDQATQWAENLALTLCRQRDSLALAEQNGTGKVLIPAGMPGHGFNILAHGREDNPSAGLVETWKWDRQAALNTVLTAEQQRSILYEVFEQTGVASYGHFGYQALDRLGGQPRTAGQLYDFMAQLKADEPRLFNDQKGDEDWAAMETALAEHAHAVSWTQDKLVRPGQVSTNTAMTPEDQRRIVEATLNSLQVPSNHRVRQRILGRITQAQTPKALHDLVFQQLRADNNLLRDLAQGNADKLSDLVAQRILNNMPDPPPRVVIGDMNYESNGLRVDVGLVHNPISNQIEPGRSARTVSCSSPTAAASSVLPCWSGSLC